MEKSTKGTEMNIFLRLGILAAFVFLLFQQGLLHATDGILDSAIRYTDELLTCLLAVAIGIRLWYRKTHLERAEYVMMIALAVFALMGVVSNVVHPMQSWFNNLVDLLACTRFVICYLGVRILLCEPGWSKTLLRDLHWVCRIISIVITAIVIHDLLFPPFFSKSEFRYFTYSLKLFFNHPTFLAVFCATLACVLMAGMAVDKKYALLDYCCIGAMCAVMVLTFRSKAVAAAACMIFLFVLFFVLKIHSKLILVGGGSLLALIIGAERFMFYYATDVEGIARSRMHRDAFILANDYFPLGTGFATFGSSVAAQHYSPLYLQLGYENLHGASPDNPVYLKDTFWPIVMGQTGWLGTIAFVAVLACFAWVAFRIQRKNLHLYWSALSILVYVLIASTSESAFFHPVAVPLFLLLGLVVNVAFASEDCPLDHGKWKAWLEKRKK